MKSSNGTIIAQEPVSKKTGYGIIEQRVLPAGDYQLLVINFGDSNSINEFTVSSYAQDRVEILEEKKALQLAISRAESMSPNELITSKVGNFTGKSFLDETR